MDTRLYILAGTFALVVLSLIVLVVSLVRARRAPLQPLVPEPGPWPALMSAPASVIEMHVAESTPFAEPSGGIAAVLGEPLRTGSWQPTTENVDRVDAPVDYWDSLIDDPALLVRPTTPRTPQPAPQPTPEPTPEPAPEPAFVPVPEPAPAPVPEPAPEPAFVPAPEPVPEPAPPEPAFVPVPEPAPEPVPEPAFVPVPEPVLVSEPEAVFEPAVVDILPEPDSDDVFETDEWLDTLVAQLEDANDMPEAVFEPVPVVLPAPEPETQPELQPEPEPQPRPEPIPVLEIPLASPELTPVVPVAPMPVAPIPVVPAPLPVIPLEVAETATVPEPAAPVRDVPEYVLVAPVEMWFGEARVGVKPGSRTYEQFQRYASVMFDDLKRSAGTR